MIRRLVLGGCGAVIALAAALQLADTGAPSPSAPQVQLADRAESRSPSYPPAMGGPDIVQQAPQTAAERRNEIIDSTDLYAAVSKITVQSPTIDKLAASEALLACADFRLRRNRASEEQAAAQALAERCMGIRRNMRRNEAVEKAIELRASAEDDRSPLGRLALLSRQSGAGKARWHDAEITLVNEALRSGDLVLVTEAIRALQVQLDDGLSDARMRTEAFERAADLFVLLKDNQRTVFDALVDCANLSRCSGRFRANHGSTLEGIRERSQMQRLTEQYRLALQRGKTTEELLAIR